MWYLFYDIFQNSFFMENHLAEHVHIFWNYICIMEWTDSLQEALIENQDRVWYYIFWISFNCSISRNSIFTQSYNHNIKSFFYCICLSHSMAIINLIPLHYLFFVRHLHVQNFYSNRQEEKCFLCCHLMSHKWFDSTIFMVMIELISNNTLPALIKVRYVFESLEKLCEDHILRW